jgi:putative hemolysin
MDVILTELGVILLLLMLNGVFAMSELAIVSAKRVRLEHRAARGDAGARAALGLATDPGQFLSTVQVGITLVGVIASVFGGATIAEVLEARFAQIPWLASRAEGAALAVVVAGITFLSLIIGELVPKRIALSNPERVAALVARPMRIVSKVARPIVVVLTGSTNLVLRLLRLRGDSAPGLTEQEIHALVEQGAEAGVVPRVEHDLVEGVFRLGDRQAASIMTPRPDVEWVDVDAAPSEVRRVLAALRSGHLLVCDGGIERVVGVAYVERLLAQCLGDAPIVLRDALAEPLYVPATMPVLRLLDALRAARQRVAIALDEYGGVQGVVTLDDILEEMVGQLPTRPEEAPSLVRTGEFTWTMDGSTAIEDVMDELGLDDLDAGGRRGFRTLGGYLLSHLGRVPRPGEGLDRAGYRFEVASMEGRRIGDVRIMRRPTSPRSDATPPTG